MSGRYEIPAVRVGDRVKLTGKDWASLAGVGNEAVIAGFENPGSAEYGELPYFIGDNEDHLYVYRGSTGTGEDYWAEVVPATPETTPIHDRLAEKYSEFNYDPYVDPDFYGDPWERLTGDVDTVEPYPGEYTLSIPGIGYGVATSQEDYDAMVKYVAGYTGTRDEPTGTVHEAQVQYDDGEWAWEYYAEQTPLVLLREAQKYLELAIRRLEP